MIHQKKALRKKGYIKTKIRKKDILSQLAYKLKPGVDGSTHHISEVMPNVEKIVGESLRGGGYYR